MASPARLGDLSTGHDGYPPRPAVEASSNVFIDGVGAVRVGDHYDFHNKPVGVNHNGVVASGSTTVFVNGQGLAREGDPIDDGLEGTDHIGPGSGSVVSD